MSKVFRNSFYEIYPEDFGIEAGCKSVGCGKGKSKSVPKTRPNAKPYKPVVIKPSKGWGK